MSLVLLTCACAKVIGTASLLCQVTSGWLAAVVPLNCQGQRKPLVRRGWLLKASCGRGLATRRNRLRLRFQLQPGILLDLCFDHRLDLGAEVVGSRLERDKRRAVVALQERSHQILIRAQ